MVQVDRGTPRRTLAALKAYKNTNANDNVIGRIGFGNDAVRLAA
jgi:hypothetical protein